MSNYTEYQKTTWSNGQSYGEDAFNNIEDGIKNLEQLVLEGGTGSSGASSNTYAALQNLNMATAMKKLKFGQVPQLTEDGKKTNYVPAVTEFAFLGDSVFWGFNTLESDTTKIPTTCVDDQGTTLSGFSQSDVRIPNEFKNVMQSVYGSDRVRIKDKSYTGMDCLRALNAFNATGSDFTFINFGINDAVGAHVSKSYLGWIEKYIPQYRLIVEKQIAGGSAVIIVGLVKQTLVGPTSENPDLATTDADSRMMTELYDQALKDIADEYGCLYLSGDDLTRDFDNTFSIDFTHFVDEAYTTIGGRLAAPFIGATHPKYPNKITASTYLGVNPQLDNIKLINDATVQFSEKSPNYPISLATSDLYAEDVIRNPGGPYAKCKGFGKIAWSFYAEQDGMVVIPSFYTESNGIIVDMKLDFGAKQGKWSNYWNSVSSVSIDRDYIEPTTVSIAYTANMQTHDTGKRYGLHMINSINQPALKIVSKGWHTITLEVSTKTERMADMPSVASIPTPNEEFEFHAYGINILTPMEYQLLTK